MKKNTNTSQQKHAGEVYSTTTQQKPSDKAKKLSEEAVRARKWSQMIWAEKVKIARIELDENSEVINLEGTDISKVSTTFMKGIINFV